MRVSAERDSADYSPLAIRYGRVLFNGLPLKLCVEADEDAGRVVVYDTDGRGRLKVTRDRERARTRTMHGKVKVCFPPHIAALIQAGER